ncbi:S-adenosyl-L-methionine-dependent methyltransferase [Penicillium odoratum]|uniref:S-adenosyl-L-methionine-dependent methyltransferase n=1 Tax=Penicillium odoratum TaxID=1167516 RepID=UPI0025475F4B|nr:S-adenosyl-L-methionine-dependent methyltransferase [Penicillium odoratum]KAJ5759510.1 S-adenosyl-L-methionine-dependent methyltransferase [Penicillium odoratum]
MSVSDALSKVQKLVSEESAGNNNTHAALLKAIRELQLAVETPLETTSRLNFQILQNISIRVAIEHKFLHVLVTHGKSISAAELAQETGSNLLLIIRVMRVLSAVGLCDEIDNQLYAANDKTRFKILPGSIAAEKHHFDLDFGMGGRLVDYMRGPGIQQFADEPDAITLFKYAYGTDVIFGLLEKNPEQKEAFDDYMAARRVDDMPQWFEIYPIASTLRSLPYDPSAALIVDVGGGPGQELIRFKERYPDLPGRFVLQDLPITLNRIVALPEGIEAVEYDFFTPQPVKGMYHASSVTHFAYHALGSQIYFLRDVLHNWSDAKSALILSQIVEAMDPDYSILVIDDYVLPDTGAELRAAEMDILMWLHTAGLERTVSQWKNLFDKVGLELVDIWSSPRGNESVLETRVRK